MQEVGQILMQKVGQKLSKSQTNWTSRACGTTASRTILEDEKSVVKSLFCFILF